MERLRKDAPDQAPATTEAKTEAAKPEAAPIKIVVPLNQSVATSFEGALGRYAERCRFVREALLKPDDHNAYIVAKSMKTESYEQCKELFEKVLAHIGVRSP